MHRGLIIALGLLLSEFCWAESTVPIYPNDDITINWDDKASMQRGARTFVNYCMGCHSANYARYNRLGRDLEISDQQLRDNLIFTTERSGEQNKVGALMTINMNTEYAEQAFGISPPDLSLVARSRGVDWLYNYLRGFYLDPSRPFGMNNSVFSNVAMPHALVALQGDQQAKKITRPDGQEMIVGFDIVNAGSMSKSEYDRVIYDLVAFLDYLSEPYRQTRQNVGIGVITFLFIFLILAYFLKKEIWKDLH